MTDKVITKYDRKFNLYKGSGCIRFNMVPAKAGEVFTENAKTKQKSRIIKTDSRDAGVYVEMASGTRGNYDWENTKLQAKLGIMDINKILMAIRSGGKVNANLVHDPGAGTDNKGQVFKHINFTKMKDGPNWMFEIVCYEQQPGKKKEITRQVKVPIFAEEIISLSTLLQYSIPYITGWAITK